MEQNRDIALAEQLAQKVAAHGGRAYYVGGCVRDAVTHTPIKDVDVEVYGISAQTLREILSELGEVFDKGASFGVLGLRHSDMDIAMPRRESCRGNLHTDFDVSVDPYLSTEDASRRRDFTCNAMMEDILTGEITDHWGGREDLQNGVLRMVWEQSFGEDALRAFRAAQFAARLRLRIDENTMEKCRALDVTRLSRERIFEETCKALLKAERPSVYFEALREMGHLREFFPELADTIGLNQSPVYHPEGDVFRHTMLVLDAAAGLRDRAEWQLGFMFAALLHDLGKIPATSTDEYGNITSHGHEMQGLPLVEAQMRRLTNQTKLIQYVVNMSELHMRPNMLARAHSKKVKTRYLFDISVCPNDLILLSRADVTGKLDAPYNPAWEAFLRERLEDYRMVMARPMVTGEDIANAGVKPGKIIGEMLKRTRQLHFAGIEKKRALAEVLKEFAQKADEA